MTAIDERKKILKIMVQKKIRTIILGCDLNFQINGEVDGLTGKGVWKDADSSCGDRAEQFYALCCEFDLKVTNTFTEDENYACKFAENSQD